MTYDQVWSLANRDAGFDYRSAANIGRGYYWIWVEHHSGSRAGELIVLKCKKNKIEPLKFRINHNRSSVSNAYNFSNKQHLFVGWFFKVTIRANARNVLFTFPDFDCSGGNTLFSIPIANSNATNVLGSGRSLRRVSPRKKLVGEWWLICWSPFNSRSARSVWSWSSITWTAKLQGGCVCDRRVIKEQRMQWREVWAFSATPARRPQHGRIGTGLR